MDSHLSAAPAELQTATVGWSTDAVRSGISLTCFKQFHYSITNFPCEVRLQANNHILSEMMKSGHY